MKVKQLIALFLSILVPYTVGGLVMPLLPVYLARLGIDTAISGFYFAVAFLSLAAGSIIGGWISDRFQKRRQTLFISGLIGFPLIYMMGQVNHILPLTILTMTVWFLGGVNVATVNIIAGMFAEPHERGRIFGIIGTGLSIGGVIGGVASGRIVDAWGFAALFTITGIVQSMIVVTALMLDDKVVPVRKRDDDTPPIPVMNMALWLLFGAGILANIANLSTGLSRPLAMDTLGFTATAVASANAVGSLVTIPISTLLGWVSDRIGRKPVLIGAYSIATIGLLILTLATNLWQFWLATALIMVIPTSIGVGNSLVTDVSQPETLGTALARYASIPFVGGALGFAGGGMIMSNFDVQSTFIAAMIVAVLAVMMLLPIGRQRKTKTLAYGGAD